jgi:hypothetical protein
MGVRMGPTLRALLVGALIGAAFEVQEFMSYPSYVNFGGMFGAAVLGALAGGIVYRAFGNRKPKV